ncbi:MAG: DUF6125 family protein [Raoultibacter sp.]
MGNIEALESLSKEKLIELVEIYSKNLIAMDGVWFQSIERKFGMDEAMYHDEEAWKRFTITEAMRIKKFLGLPERAGLEGLEKALSYKLNTLSNLVEVKREGAELIYRIVDCRVQTARKRKNMPFHPCKSVGMFEYEGFARTLDERIVCECLSCFPDITDETCSCSWKFTLVES